MTVKDIIKLISYGQPYEIKGELCEKTYHKSYANSDKNLEKYLDKEVANPVLSSDIRKRGSFPDIYFTTVIVIWIREFVE